MRTPDIAPLIQGVFVLIAIAVGLGQYPRLEHWARAQALGAMQWEQPFPLVGRIHLVGKKQCEIGSIECFPVLHHIRLP